MAEALPRFQHLERAQTHQEAAVHTPQSGHEGLVASPELWRWSSYRAYSLGEPGRVKDAPDRSSGSYLQI